jgi:glycosyltransferase involved in cell wall biosynthesis
MRGHSLRIGIDGRAIYKTVDGIGRYSLNLIRNLAAIDRTNQYFIFKNPEIKERIADGSNFHEVEVGFRHLSLRTVLCLPLVTKRLFLDVFHAPFFVCPVWGMKNVVLTVHDLMALTFPSFFGGRTPLKEKAAFFYHRLFVPLSIKRARKIIAVSNSTKLALMEMLQVQADRISVTHEAVDDRFEVSCTKEDVEAFRIRHNLPHEYMLYVGNMKPYKNITLIVSALEILKTTKALTKKLVIAGRQDRFFPAIYEELKGKDLLSDVIFVGYVADHELPLLFGNAAVFLFPSLCEGFGLPPLEAMSLGVPTIVSNASSLPEVVANGALLIDPKDPQDLAGTILKVLNDMDLRRKLSQKGMKRSRAFSWETMARQTLTIYNEVCQER